MHRCLVLSTFLVACIQSHREEEPTDGEADGDADVDADVDADADGDCERTDACPAQEPTEGAPCSVPLEEQCDFYPIEGCQYGYSCSRDCTWYIGIRGPLE